VTANEWRHWFIRERLELHGLLVECMATSDTPEQKLTALYEHDMIIPQLARHAQMRIARADLVSVLAVRCQASAG